MVLRSASAGSCWPECSVIIFVIDLTHIQKNTEETTESVKGVYLHQVSLEHERVNRQLYGKRGKRTGETGNYYVAKITKGNYCNQENGLLNKCSQVARGRGSQGPGVRSGEI
ncbi:hypothetical protein ATANTOWER_010759 [Ataeniobius toweri]|uniref:Uncharacterized protein n=1 Tax=Ataeniobius toweri TaxID=208326 RepID=A0ABU7BSK4_9TELE|nr:hypothetical protein [Ataeniobius toweri]